MEILRPTGIEGTIRKNSYSIEIGGKSATALMTELTQNDILVGRYAQVMMRSRDFSTLEKPTEIRVARVTPGDLGFTQYPTTDQFLKKAQSFGLERLPAESGPHACLQDRNQSRGGWYYIAMNPIPGGYGYPYVFLVGVSLLDGRWADADPRWRNLGLATLFGLRK